MINEKMNISELARNLGWTIRGTEYQHLITLLNYMTLNEALKLILLREAKK